MSEDDVEELVDRSSDLQTELNELHQQRMAKSDNADEKLVMFRKQVRNGIIHLFLLTMTRFTSSSHLRSWCFASPAFHQGHREYH